LRYFTIQEHLVLTIPGTAVDHIELSKIFRILIEPVCFLIRPTLRDGH